MSNVFLSSISQACSTARGDCYGGNAFVQDDIKLTQSYTLNLRRALRADGESGRQIGPQQRLRHRAGEPQSSAAGTIEGYVVSQNFPVSVPAGVKQLDNTYGIRGEHQNNWGPRLGFAWRLPNSFLPLTERMVLRGGYGIYYTRATGNRLSNWRRLHLSHCSVNCRARRMRRPASPIPSGQT
jgi:hypothetical protein